MPDSFAHPAKMDAQLLIWLVEHYSQPGETILDPMAGSGTLMLACGLGRNVILLELEKKFCKICEANWEKVRQRPQLGFSMGECLILQGDARNLSGILADKIITSPPYAIPATSQQSSRNVIEDRIRRGIAGAVIKDGKYMTGNGKREEKYSDNPSNLGNLPYGSIDKVITSPPYSENPGTPSLGSVNKDDWGHEGTDIVKRRGLEKGYSDNPSNLGNLPYGDIDSIITSPPYEASVADNKESPLAGGDEKRYGRWKKGTAKKTSYTQHGEPVDSIITSPPYEGTIDRTKEGTRRGIRSRMYDEGKFYGMYKDQEALAKPEVVPGNCFVPHSLIPPPILPVASFSYGGLVMMLSMSP